VIASVSPTVSSGSPASPTTRQASISLPSDTEVVITREFNAPAALVYEAMSKPEHVRRWWGLRGSNLLVCEMDVRVGGKWRYVLGEEGGEQHAFSGEYKEIDPPGKIVFTERYEPIPGSDHVITSTLTERDGRTILRAHMSYASREQRDGHLQSGMEHGLQETYQRLDELLATLA
jgi:uncharacterized protein YndB with AHSA1/START domain